jgi:predicted nucleotidyltransferase component of viral defense system
MIAEAELRRAAARAGVDLTVQDLDYGLGWFLAGLFTQPDAARRLVFKGGTCLRKCYFPGYRFSEDLDFTLSRAWQLSDLAGAIEAVRDWSIVAGGPDFGAAPPRLETIDDEYGMESFQARVYYRGPLRWAGPPRAIRLDVTRAEQLVFPTNGRPLHHPYSDVSQVPAVVIPCYSPLEMLAEKLRALAGQRRFAISRDIYDIYQLVQGDVPLRELWQALPAKLAAKGMQLSSLDLGELAGRRSAFETDWQRRLTYLLPSDQPITFEAAWQSALQLIGDLQTGVFRR